jgi:hypothetical protein
MIKIIILNKNETSVHVKSHIRKTKSKPTIVSTYTKTIDTINNKSNNINNNKSNTISDEYMKSIGYKPE